MICLGFTIGTITGLFGVGGGFLLTPFLRIVFNISYPMAIGCSMLQILATSVLSAYKHWQNNNVDIKMGIVTAIGSLIGTEFGVQILRHIAGKGSIDIGGHSMLVTDLIINVCYLLLLGSVAFFMYREASANNQCGLEEPQTKLKDIIRNCLVPPIISFPKSNIPQLSVWIPVLLSLLVGILTGMLGIGGGFVSFPLLVYALGMPTKLAVGTSTIQIFLASGYGVFRYVQNDLVDFLLVMFMFLGSTLGVNLGVKLSQKINPYNTRKYFVGLIIMAILLIVYDLFRRMLV